ncbi:metacaspase-1 isoform X3 [Sesamum indicum]|uniref:Metacaspase-1 isoform X3 n=1 Tax=Sesamum indicum TaxID=4182 RepID=A0A6I9TVX7_SESIN|nr:metacaspase-1 isoform X3 [Sesamum indicum]
MATRRINCRWCGMPSLVQLEAQTLRCPACNRVTKFQSNVYVRPQQPVNVGRVYPGQLQVRAPPTQLRVPPAHGRKRAVLCGITYKGHKQSLDGSINDVLFMKKLLVERFGFPNSSILVLTEEEDFSRIPTKKNIRAALQWLVRGCQAGDSLVFHYSGHGSQVVDRDGDELDGYDECLLPVDYETEGRILDDELNATIVRPLPTGATLHSVIDTCFSGTFLDLPNVCRMNREGYYKWEDHRVPHAAAYKGTSGGIAIGISACDDHQNSGDTTAFTGVPTGALTYSFVKTLEQEPRLTYGRLLIFLHNRINAARDQVGLSRDAPHLSQEPQLSSSHKFEIHSKPFTL